MIDISVPSRFGDNKTFLKAQLLQKADGFYVDEISSPIPSVNASYSEEVSHNFNYSFVDENGYHEVVGREGELLRNLLILLARQTSSSKRRVVFDLNDDSATGMIDNNQFQAQLKENPSLTISQIEAIFSGDSLSRVSVWLFYFYHVVLQDMGESIADGIAESLLLSEVISEVINSLDSRFFFNHSPKNSYLNARKQVSSGTTTSLRIINYLSFGSAANDVHWRNSASGSIAARSMREHRQLTSEDLKKVLHLFSETKNLKPAFLPQIRSTRATALAILSHFDGDLPAWDILCSEIGVALYKVELESPILGLFLSNSEAHQAVIIVNVAMRSDRSHNYTIAHEIGHYLLHYDYPFIECDTKAVYFPDVNNEVEIEANNFASELLMPSGSFRNECRGAFNFDQVDSLSREFNVSKEAVARRMVEIVSNRKLAFFIIKGCTITSMIASAINEQGVRWIGRPSVGSEAVNVYDAIQLTEKNETSLCNFFSDIDPDKEWLRDLDINIYPFQRGDGYYLFVESSLM